MKSTAKPSYLLRLAPRFPPCCLPPYCFPPRAPFLPVGAGLMSSKGVGKGLPPGPCTICICIWSENGTVSLQMGHFTSNHNRSKRFRKSSIKISGSYKSRYFPPSNPNEKRSFCSFPCFEKLLKINIQPPLSNPFYDQYCRVRLYRNMCRQRLVPIIVLLNQPWQHISPVIVF